MSGQPDIVRRECPTHRGCVVLSASMTVGGTVVPAAVTYNPRNTMRDEAEAELLQKLADAVAKERWRQNR